MKSPETLAAELAQQWQSADTREHRLLSPEAWPHRVSIGRPAPAKVANATAEVRDHLARWRGVNIGTVTWQDVTYRSAAGPINVPLQWALSSPAEWAQASASPDVMREFERLDMFMQRVDPIFHPRLVRQRSLWQSRSNEDVIRATDLAMALEPGIASGRPLRALGLAGVDTKFFENHGSLIAALLDTRFDSQVSAQGLASFLGAEDEGDHWLLVVPLSAGILPFSQQRVRAREISDTPLPASRILLVENESCIHQLPSLPDAVAILGFGLDLAWMATSWLGERRVGYWGDLDTWGLTMLARARQHQGHLEPLLMTRIAFDQHAHLATCEPVSAGPVPLYGLLDAERDLYAYLTARERGRLEQEFLPTAYVRETLSKWGRVND
jgi:hypothetical protein